MTAEVKEKQRVVLDLIDDSLQILNGKYTRDLRNTAKMDEIQRKYPYVSEVHTTVIDGQPFIVSADEKITDIVGYAPEELKGKPVRFIMAKDFDQVTLANMITDLNENGMCVKMNDNLCKDGSIVRTFGWIFNLGNNSCREFVMKLENVLGHDLG